MNELLDLKSSQREDLDGRKKKWVSYLYRTAQPSTLAVFLPWGIKQELVVQDLPAAKVGNIHELMRNFSENNT